jgi:hypothetical protein
MATNPVAVEKGTRVVILLNFSVFGERTFNNLQRRYLAETLRKEFFNSHSRFHRQRKQKIHRRVRNRQLSVLADSQKNESASATRASSSAARPKDASK